MQRLEEKSRQKEERRQEEERKRNEKLLKLEAGRRQKEKIQQDFERKQFGLGDLHTRRKENQLGQICEQGRTVDFNEERDLREHRKFEEEHPCKTTLVRRELWEIAETFLPPENIRVRNGQHIKEKPRPYQERNDSWRAHDSQNNEKTETLLKIGGGVLVCAGLLLSAKIRAIATVGTFGYQAYTAYKAMNERPKTPRYYS